MDSPEAGAVNEMACTHLKNAGLRLKRARFKLQATMLHSTFSGVTAVVLSLFYGTPRIPFSTTSDGLPNVVREFRAFLQAAREAALSRMYLGIHFKSANDDGLAVGLAIGAWTFKKTMRPR